MMVLPNFLNRRGSTRSLADEQFADILPSLAKELSEVDYRFNHSDSKLLDDWKKLVQWNPNQVTINSTNRVGMKLCEHFFPNFFDISDSKGNSFSSLWTDPKFMEKVLTWNRKSHSTPYLSELRRGVYFCGGLPKSTMYRPQMAKMVTRGSKVVLDPCAGWGGRMLGSVANQCHYIAFEPNTATYENLNRLADFLGIRSHVTLICDDALNMGNHDFPVADTVLTSPPYFNLEVYTDETTQSVHGCSSYSEWADKFLGPVIKSCVMRLDNWGKSCWNVSKVKSHDMWDSINQIHASLGYGECCQYNVVSSSRQVNKNSRKSVDRTLCYLKTN
jgi:hypothetical protein